MHINGLWGRGEGGRLKEVWGGGSAAIERRRWRASNSLSRKSGKVGMFRLRWGGLSPETKQEVGCCFRQQC